MAGRTSHEALGGLRPICETSTSDGKPFFATGTVFADHMRVDTRLWLEEGGGFHPARQTAWLATDEIKLRLPTMIQLPTSSTGVRSPGHRHRPSVGEGGLVGVKGPKWPSLFFFFFFESAFVYRNSYLVQGQDAVPYFRTKIR